MQTTNPIGVPKTKRQHYVPQFFLAGFTKFGRFDVLYRDKSNRLQLMKRQKPANIAHMHNLYEAMTPNSSEKGEAIFPNAIENNLSAAESVMKKKLDELIDWALAVPLDKSDTSEELNDYCNLISTLIASFSVRSPKSVKEARENASSLYETMLARGYGTEDALSEVYREAMGTELSPGVALDPNATAEHLALRMRILPFRSKDEQSELEKYANYLRNCSFALLTTTSDHPFVGISEPHFEGIVDVGTGRKFGALYFPLESRLAIILFDDDGHIFKKRSLSHEELHEFNRLALSGQEFEFAFCHRGDYLTHP